MHMHKKLEINPESEGGRRKYKLSNLDSLFSGDFYFFFNRIKVLYLQVVLFQVGRLFAGNTSHKFPW